MPYYDCLGKMQFKGAGERRRMGFTKGNTDRRDVSLGFVHAAENEGPRKLLECARRYHLHLWHTGTLRVQRLEQINPALSRTTASLTTDAVG